MNRPVRIGRGVAWIAARTGKDHKELLASPAALADAVRELAALAARAGSDDPEAKAEMEALPEQFANAPSPGETFGRRLAQILRDTADRLRKEAST